MNFTDCEKILRDSETENFDFERTIALSRQRLMPMPQLSWAGAPLRRDFIEAYARHYFIKHAISLFAPHELIHAAWWLFYCLSL